MIVRGFGGLTRVSNGKVKAMIFYRNVINEIRVKAEKHHGPSFLAQATSDCSSIIAEPESMQGAYPTPLLFRHGVVEHISGKSVPNSHISIAYAKSLYFVSADGEVSRRRIEH